MKMLCKKNNIFACLASVPCAVITVVLFIFLLNSCNDITDFFAPEQGPGNATIKIDNGGGPAADTYEIVLDGEGKGTEERATGESEETFEGLASGYWTVTITAYNDEEKIVGSAEVGFEVDAGKTVIITVIVIVVRDEPLPVTVTVNHTIGCDSGGCPESYVVKGQSGSSFPIETIASYMEGGISCPSECPMHYFTKWSAIGGVTVANTGSASTTFYITGSPGTYATITANYRKMVTYRTSFTNPAGQFIFEVPAEFKSIESSSVTVIGGGGGGDGGYGTYTSGYSAGSCYGGGGGAGEVVTSTALLQSGVTYQVRIGAGGSGGPGNCTGCGYEPSYAGDGSSSSFSGGANDLSAAGGSGARNASGGSGYPPGTNGGCCTIYFGQPTPPCANNPPVGRGGNNSSGYGRGGDGSTGESVGGQNGQSGAVIVEVTGEVSD
ncbi:MAG: hypothetical protein JW881_13680 [Spirochaetales bacterium]|nr:hypothetical protein [Spirochaetales bacterium]